MSLQKQKKSEAVIVCGQCGATYPGFNPVAAVRHWQAFGGKTDEHQVFNCLAVDGSVRYHVRMTMEGFCSIEGVVKLGVSLGVVSEKRASICYRHGSR